MMAALEAARDALAAIPGVVTCKIGNEDGISPADYPLIRIVPDTLAPGRPYGRRTATVRIFFGIAVGQADGGLESVYTAMFALEASILTVVKTLDGRYLETVMDSDNFAPFKVAAVRAELTG